MKKFIFALLVVIGGLFLSTAAFSNTTSQAFSHKSLAAGASTIFCDAYPTCITVTNWSSDYITVEVPALWFKKPLEINGMWPIYSYDTNYKQLILTNRSGYIFFNYMVPPHFDLTVKDYNGTLQVSTR